VVMGLESLVPVLVSDIPSDVALVIGSACGGALITAIGVLYRRQIVLEDRTQANVERYSASAYATADSLNKLTDAIRGATREKAS
jgi:hypothetical protein